MSDDKPIRDDDLEAPGSADMPSERQILLSIEALLRLIVTAGSPTSTPTVTEGPGPSVPPRDHEHAQ